MRAFVIQGQNGQNYSAPVLFLVPFPQDSSTQSEFQALKIEPTYSQENSSCRSGPCIVLLINFTGNCIKDQLWFGGPSDAGTHIDLCVLTSLGYFLSQRLRRTVLLLLLLLRPGLAWDEPVLMTDPAFAFAEGDMVDSIPRVLLRYYETPTPTPFHFVARRDTLRIHIYSCALDFLMYSDGGRQLQASAQTCSRWLLY